MKRLGFTRFHGNATLITRFLTDNLAGSLPPGILLTSEGTDLTIRQGTEIFQCMDLALVDSPDGADEYAELVHVALDNIQTVVSRLTTLPWPPGEGGPVNAYSAVREGSIIAGYGTAEAPLLALPPLRLSG